MGDVVRKTKNGKFLGWYIRYKDTDNKRKQRASHQPTKELAKRFLGEVEARIARGKIGIPEPEPPKQELTLEQLRDKFLQQYTRPRLKDVDGYRDAAKVELGRLPETWLRRPASAVTLLQVEELRDQLGCIGAKSEDEGYARNTINGTLRALSRVYTWGRAKKLIDCENPCKGVERHRVESLLEYLCEEDPGEVDRMLREGRARCWGPAPTLPPTLFPAAATVLFTGMRKGELWAWRWIDLDLETRRHDVMRAVGHGGKIGKPKGGKERHLRLPLRLVPILRAWRPLCPPTPEGLVFPVPVERWDRSAERLARLEQEAAGAGDRARDARKMLRRMAEAMPVRWRMGRHDDDLHLRDLLKAANCKLSAAGRDWHMLRHTFSRKFMEEGGNIVRLMEILGHSDIKMTMIYARFASGRLGDEMDRVVYPAAAPLPEGVISLDERR